MRKIGLFITTLLHDITQAGYEVSFVGDFRGMVRIDLKKEYVTEFYEHRHCGFPGATREQLEKDIIDALIRFKTDFSVEDATSHDDRDPDSAA